MTMGCRDASSASFTTLVKVGRTPRLVAVTKHGHQPGRPRTVPTRVTDEAFRNTMDFERVVKPTAPALVGMAIRGPEARLR